MHVVFEELICTWFMTIYAGNTFQHIHLAMLANPIMYLRQILWMAMRGEERGVTLKTPTMRDS